ncbi:MAG TPA: hypothetical protein VFQ45_08425 [Longimicrobium sp.]|nr:hypothetical protein [Longimicrobium sp.]
MPRPPVSPARGTATRPSARAAQAPASDSEGTLRFSTVNLALLAAGLVSIIVGFVLLGQASTVAAPILLVLGFVVLVPLGIIL